MDKRQVGNIEDKWERSLVKKRPTRRLSKCYSYDNNGASDETLGHGNQNIREKLTLTLYSSTAVGGLNSVSIVLGRACQR